jgi:hypothetical protein
MENERLKAKREIGLFLAHRTSFVRDFGYNAHRKVYSREFGLLICGKTELSRMVMFSNDETSQLLLDFGLAFGRNDDPEAFAKLKQLTERVREYGEPAGKISRFLGIVEQYPHSLPFILTILILAIAIVYYVISGQQLPIG